MQFSVRHPHSVPVSLLPGYRFRPTDEELISYFLRRKIEGLTDHDDDCPVKKMDLYGEKEPWEIWDMFGGPFLEQYGNGVLDLFFFTKLKFKKSRVERNVGSGGTWSGEKLGKIFAPGTGKLLGFSRRFHYENTTIHHQDHAASWIMHEFSMPHPSSYVLCRLRKSCTHGNKKLVPVPLPHVPLPASVPAPAKKRKSQEQPQSRPTKKPKQSQPQPQPQQAPAPPSPISSTALNAQEQPTKEPTNPIQPQPQQAPIPATPATTLVQDILDLDDFINEVGIWDCDFVNFINEVGI